MLARMSTMNACTMMVVVPEYTMYGNSASTTTTASAPTPVQATFRRDLVTRNFSSERVVVSVATVMTVPPLASEAAAPSCRCRAGGQAGGAEDKHGEEDDVPGETPVRDVYRAPDRLAPPQHHPAEQGPPQRAEPADHHGREREQEDRV